MEKQEQQFTVGPETGPGGEQQVRVGFEGFTGNGWNPGMKRGEFIGHGFKREPRRRCDIGGQDARILVWGNRVSHVLTLTGRKTEEKQEVYAAFAARRICDYVARNIIADAPARSPFITKN
jgi:hypothetical protein